MFKTLQELQIPLRCKVLMFPARLRHKVNNLEKGKTDKIAPDVLKCLENCAEYHDIKDKLPKNLLRKYKSPESMYLINKKTAKDIVSTIQNHLNNSPIIEVNPGLGLITKHLLNCQKNHIYLYESSNYFSQHLHVSIFLLV